ncbi:hypothetical protein QBC35DRAFT_208978 [Podospora australis]|uniref:Uncharacterized protein n=1 Tax=Podospora australis TaxID=1536484 RepID=A0AAN6WUD1_9PEZI|nr:hypothetical protein QBC35DRAFT_208978 [Podospora australis]
MGIWLFRRKSRWKRSRANTTEFDDSRGRAAELPRSQTAPDAVMAVIFPPTLERQGTKKQRAEPNKLRRRPRAYSFSPGRDDSIQVGRSKSTRNKREAGNTLPMTQGGDYRVANKASGGKLNITGLNAADEEIMRRVPTLHNKRDGDHLPRKKSSKKQRRDDPQREAEIRAMSNFVPVRPAAEDWMAGRPMKKESKRVKTGLAFGLRGSKEWEKRSSNISLPAADSIDSALSSDSDYISFRVSALEALAPRPTLRYTAHPRGTPEGTGLVRRSSQQRRATAPIPEATLKAHKRVANLADDLDASDLRELMERDQRRRDRKRQRDQERIEQRLARRAEKQKAADAEAQRQGRDSPPNLERGVLGREPLGLGVDPTSAVVTSSRIRHSHTAEPQEDQEKGNVSQAESLPAPLAAFHRVDSIPLQTPQPAVEPMESVPPLASPRSRSSFLRLKRSKSPLESETRTEHTESLRKGSESSSSRGPLSWASFFRWSNKNKRNSAGPSSFSNTSRDSMQTAQAPTPVTFVPRRLSTGVPKRTMSRFREDLPELPMSPPDSRIQSPEADPIPPIIESSPDTVEAEESPILASLAPGERYDTPVSEQQSLEAMRETPSTFSHPDEPEVSPVPQAMSLASIDSEASWFSGGGMSRKRKSSGIMQQRHGSHSQLARHTPDSERVLEHDNEHEDMSITEDDYMSRLAPAPVHGDRPGWNRKSTGEARPSSDWEEEAAPHWGNVNQQHPTVVHSHAIDKMKSREGLLNTFTEGEGSPDPRKPRIDDSDDGEAAGEGSSGLQRATSINLGKNARRISAGSARLLSITTPRSSVDTRRTSQILKGDGV